MYKIVAIDLDETLYNDDRQICKRNKEAIKKARALGVKIVPCSGRGPKFLGDLYDQLDLNSDDEFSILANGAIIVHNKSNEIIECNPIPFNKVQELFDFGVMHNVCVQIFLKDCVYFYYIDEEEKEMVNGFGSNLIFKYDNDLSELKDKKIIKMLYQKKDMPYLHTLADQMKHITDGSISISFSSNRYMEINRLGINKGIGLHSLAKHLNIDIQDTIGIGDNYNDLELIKEAGLGVAVANANDIVKTSANYICVSDNNEGGVAEAIEKFILDKVR